MQLRYEQLTQHLQTSLAPVYLLAGEVPFLIQEGADIIRNAAKGKGYQERTIYHVETGFSWSKFLAASNSFSLFANKQLIELRFPATPLAEGAKALQNYASNPPTDKILILSMSKLDAAQQKSAWLQTIVKAGVFIPIWPIPTEQLPLWIEKRLMQAGLKAEKTGIELLAAYAEGNLLTAVQEIEKLRLLADEGSVSTELISQSITDNARFDVFQLADVVLQGDRKRALRILSSLYSEGTEAILILWSLTREIRTLLQIFYRMQANLSMDQVFTELRIWEKRKPLFRHATQRLHIKNLMPLLQHASRIDQIIKGLDTGNVWDELERLVLKLTKN